MHVHEQRIPSGVQRPIRDVQESDAARATQEFPRGRGEKIAAQGSDIDRKLAHALAGVDQVGDAQPVAYGADFGRRLHQPRVGRHPADRDELAPGVGREASHVLWIDAAFRQIGGAPDVDAESPGHRQKHQLIGRIIGTGRDDDVAGVKIERLERLGESDRGVLDHGDIARLGPDEARDGIVCGAHLRTGFFGGFVAADFRLAPQMRGDHFQHRLGHQRGARIVQVDAPGATRGVGTPSGQVVGRCHRATPGGSDSKRYRQVRKRSFPR